MCMKKFDAEKIFFDKITGLLTLAIFWWLHLVSDGW